MKFIVDIMERGRRLDKFLAEKLPEISRTVLANFAEDGLVRVDGKAAGKNVKLKEGQTVEFELPEPEGDDSILPEAMSISVLYQDDDIAIVDKPAGLCVHPSPGHRTGTLVNGMLALFPRMAFVGSVKRPGVVHRLDLDTSGVIIFALTPYAYSALVGLIKSRAVKRTYKAVVHGLPKAARATISKAIGRDPLHRRKFAAFGNVSSAGAKPAVTHFEVIERFKNAALLEVKLETGRTHQIRVHLNSIGHPVFGDAFYAPGRDHGSMARQALHAESVEFEHPRGGGLITVHSPLPRDIEDLLARLRGGGR